MKRRRCLTVAAVLGFALLAMHTAWTAPPPAPPGGGEALFKKRCGGCHAADRDMEGPRLAGVFRRPAGSVKSFTYSPALKGSGIVWNEEKLDRWLSDSESMVPGTEMMFRIEQPEERQAIIEYLKHLGAK